MTIIDCVIIGAGVGGLTAGVYLTRSGKSVLMLDMQDKPGGYCTAFERNGFRFDVAVHMVGGILRDLLDILSIDLSFQPVNPLYRAIVGESVFDFPNNMPDLSKYLTELFPRERNGIQGLLDLIQKNWVIVRRNWYPPQTQESSSTIWLLAHYRNKTFSQLLDDFIQDEQLRGLFSVLCSYGGLPPERLSALYMLGILGSYLIDGAYFPTGGSQALANALGEKFEKQGGILRLNTRVNRIIVDNNNTVKSVVLVSGEIIHCKTIISNVDAYQTYYQFIGEAALSSHLRKHLSRLEVSMSVLQIFLGIKGKIDLPLETFYIPNPQIDINTALQMGDFSQTGINLTIPTVIDSQLAPLHCNTVNIIAAVPNNIALKWSITERDNRCEQIISIAEQVMPDLRRRIVVKEYASPYTFEKFTQNRYGACYGWAMLPSQMGSGRLIAKTSFPGLFLAGHWTNPGGGIVSVAQSGIRAARYVIARLDVKDR